MVMPISFAVFRLTNSLNIIDCSAAKSGPATGRPSIVEPATGVGKRMLGAEHARAPGDELVHLGWFRLAVASVRISAGSRVRGWQRDDAIGGRSFGHPGFAEATKKMLRILAVPERGEHPHVPAIV
jgi:hypothetical protein